MTGHYRVAGDDGGVRRAVSYGVAWAVAAVVATAVAWQGVALVGDEVTASRPAPLSTGEIAAAPTTSTTAAPGTTTTTTTPPAVPGTEPTGVSTPPTTSTPSAGQVGAPPATSSPAASSEVRTYALVGGDASLQFAPSGVTVLFATPKAGFTVEVSGSHGNGVRVRFDGDEHRSEVEGWWDGGPAEEVREDSNG